MHFFPKMDTRVLLALLLATLYVLSKASSDPNCPHVSSSTTVALRDDNFITLCCSFLINSEGQHIPFHSPGTTVVWYYHNSTGDLEEITKDTKLGEGIRVTFQDQDAAQNVHLNISLPGNHGRISAERNYSCGCAGNDATEEQLLIVQPLRDPNKPSTYAAEIGRPYNLPSPFALGLNRHLLTSSWSRCGATIATTEGASADGYSINGDRSLHFDNLTMEDGSSSYMQSVSYNADANCNDNDGAFCSGSSYVTLISFTKPVIGAKSQIPSVSRLVLYNGALKGGRTSLSYSHTGRPLQYVDMTWCVNITNSLYSIKNRSDSTELSFIQSKLGELDGPLSVVRATLIVSLHIAESHLNVTHQDNATVDFNILKISQSQNFQVVFERVSFTVLQARITYPQPIPAGYNFELVFYVAGDMVDSEPGDVDTSEQVVLISLNNVNTLSSVKAQMEFVYSDERFTGPEVTSAIPPYCPECIIGGVCGAVLLVMICITAVVTPVAVRRYRKRRQQRQTLVPPAADGASLHHSRRNSYSSDVPVSLYSGTGVDLGSTTHSSYPVVLVPMAMKETCSCSHLMPSTGRYCVPSGGSMMNGGRGLRSIHDPRTRACSALPEECRESSVDRQPPTRQRSYSDSQLADCFQIQRLESSRPEAHHYDIPRARYSSNTKFTNDCFSGVPRSGQMSSERDSISTGAQSTRPLMDCNNDRASNATWSGGEEVA